MNSPTHQEKRQIFERHLLFGKLSASEIDSLISYSRVERYPSGREIFAKGAPGQSLVAVLRGSIKISSLSNEGKEIVFNIINAGEIFGEIAVLDGEERSADATAMTDCEVLVLNRRDFLHLLENRADGRRVVVAKALLDQIGDAARGRPIHAHAATSAQTWRDSNRAGP